MGSAELDALPEVCGLVAEQLTSPVAGMHSVISGRVFRYLGPGRRLVRRIHDTVAGGIYCAIPSGASALGVVAGGVWAARSEATNPVSETGAARWQAMLNATWGDRLADLHNPLATETSFRSNGRPSSPEEIVGRLRETRSHMVVLLHGLGQTESCWDVPHALGSRLADHPELAPAPIRYNSGRSIQEVGREVASLVEGLWSARPRPDTKLSLVGFSLGGLVARAAFAALVGRRMGSTRALRHVITIGTPHRGSYLARTAGLAVAGLRVAKTTRPLATLLDERSAAIKELEWATGLARIPYSPDVRHHFVAATVTADRFHPIGVLLGDLVVRVGSATAPAVTTDNVTVLGGRRHPDLLTDEDVQSQLIEWLGSGTGD
jgi:pimeloyl-ACP methyl ester carboxylesterase